ncbi:MAG TPA: hypothetical protein DCQ64_09610 [Candidatus Rokubacteria bacterium]|nr:hypothetical protein [Candidatus Rokubacteria bacterium]
MFVMALDVGTSSARAVCVQADGRPLPGTEARVAYEPRITGDGGVEMDPEVLLAAVVEAVSACLAGCGARAGEIRGVGASMFWHGSWHWTPRDGRSRRSSRGRTCAARGPRLTCVRCSTPSRSARAPGRHGAPAPPVRDRCGAPPVLRE